jgi:molybdopterin converting factor subunit 1
MTVRVLFFASLARKLGQNHLNLDLPDGATVGDALRALEHQFPPLSALGSQLAIAVDLEYVGNDHTLTPDAELALIPPVSGG